MVAVFFQTRGGVPDLDVGNFSNLWNLRLKDGIFWGPKWKLEENIGDGSASSQLVEYTPVTFNLGIYPKQVYVIFRNFSSHSYLQARATWLEKLLPV